ncbi:sensor histidine kinase [Hymenobacter koreensis]|uniref:Signal transduction histidine kinase internal region domain-containing protein n=1 Tax=Hymenobacter koreensis TaxID=1084523 RepID=A0ABP8J3A5_9BACT
MLPLPPFAHRIGAFLRPQGENPPSSSQIIWRDAVVGVGLWGLSMLLLLAAEAMGKLLLFWTMLAGSGILLHCYAAYSLIPSVLGHKRAFLRYLLKVLLLLAASALLLGYLLMLATNDEDMLGIYSLFHVVVHLLLTAPLSWVLFRRRTRGEQALAGLKQELGQSNATLDSLRSQINPHFLFNALNTLYGTALQENSERTAQGIQMLGDMMRFMLHENHQPRILLAREIEYLRNYMELQSLRIVSSPSISIETHFEEAPAASWIAPMLLIPFVENAFKHGISLKRKSWIKVTLYHTQNKLFFDVYNSTHPRPEQDRLDEHSGVGLANVQQRLALVYPGRHELVIRETASEYFVHLTLDL